MIGAISETLKNPGFIGRNSDGKIIFIKSFIKKSQPKNVVSVVIERDGLKISISTHEKRDGQIKKLITEAESLQKSSPDHGTVHDERVAEPTQVDDLIIANAEEKSQVSFGFTLVKSRNKTITVVILYKTAIYDMIAVKNRR